AALAPAVRLPTQTWAWMTTAAELLAPAGSLHVVLDEGDEGRVAGVAPLSRDADEGRRLALLGVAALSEPTDLLAASPEALERLARRLARTSLPLQLERVPADSPAVEALRAAYRGRGLVVCREQVGTPTIRLGPKWEEPEHVLGARRRSDLRRARRRAESMGEVAFRFHAPGAGEVDAVLEQVYAIEARSWRAARGGSLAQDPLRGPFFRRLAERASEEGTFRAWILEIGGKPAAMQYAVEVAGGFWLLKIGYDEAFARCSPGMLLMVESIRRAAGAGLASYEFLGVIEDWTRLWTTEVRPCVTVRTYPLGLRGAAALARDGAGALGRRIRRGPGEGDTRSGEDDG
ncbi:MAG: GNAT family N-acetyltransferase, partial [Planctomycetota bacterium]